MTASSPECWKQTTPACDSPSPFRINLNGNHAIEIVWGRPPCADSCRKSPACLLPHLSPCPSPSACPNICSPLDFAPRSTRTPVRPNTCSHHDRTPVRSEVIHSLIHSPSYPHLYPQNTCSQNICSSPLVRCA